jgi:hypothetical protein
MSLINEALKKAQRQRNEAAEESVATADATTGGRIAKRAQPRSANAIFLLATGAVVLVLVSVGLTAFLVNRPSSKPAVVTLSPAPAEAPAPAAPLAAAPPIVVPPVATPAAEKPPPEPAVTPSTPAPSPPPAVAAEEKPAPVAETKAAPPPPETDERVHAFVESLRITGVKAAGDESRVLMNERVYRLNDIVDRTLNLRLTKVDGSSLTFTDANGATYVKYY